MEAAGGAPSVTSRWRGCSRRWGGDSSGPPGQDVTKRLHLLLCGGELLGKLLFIRHILNYTGYNEM